VTQARTVGDAGHVKTYDVRIPPHNLPGVLRVPPHAFSLVIFAHGSGSSRLSPRNVMVSESLNRSGIATLLFDLLQPQEENANNRRKVFEIPLLADRLVQAVRWCRSAIPPCAVFRLDSSGQVQVPPQHSSQRHALKRSAQSFRAGAGRILPMASCWRCGRLRFSLSAAKIIALSNSTNRHMLSSAGPRNWSSYRALPTSSRNTARSSRLLRMQDAGSRHI